MKGNEVMYEPVFWDIETTGLNPMAQRWWDGERAAQVICVVFGRIHNWRTASSFEEGDYLTKVLWDGDEHKLLDVVETRLREIIADIKVENDRREPFLVGWNSRNFDHPYIGARYARKRLKCEELNHGLKRLDMMRALGNDDVSPKTYPGQDDYAEALGIDVDTEITGADMPKAFEAGDWNAIESHGESDVIEMMKVFVEKKEACFEEFFDHYDDTPDNPPKFTEGVNY